MVARFCLSVLIIAQGVAPLAAAPSSQDPVFPTVVTPFLEAHCVKCHGPEKQKADLRLDTLEADFTRHHVAERWSEVMHMLNGGEMPPEEEPRPRAGRIETVTRWIAAELQAASAAAQSTGGRVVLRRLNRAEYNNTVRDLIGIDFQPAAEFPEDPPAHGFDNIGRALSVSPLHMEKYVKAAREIVDAALVSGERPRFWSWHLEVEDGHRSNEFEGRRSAGRDEIWVQDPHQDHRYLVKGGAASVREGFVIKKSSKDEGAAGFRWFKIPASGTYRIRVRAGGQVPTREQVVDTTREILWQRQEENNRKREEKGRTVLSRAEWEATQWAEAAEHFETDFIYDYGYPRLKVATDEGVIVGEVSVEVSPDDARVYEFFHTFDGEGLEGIDLVNNYQVPRVLENFWFQNRPEFARPELWIDWVEVEGPYYAEWPPASHRRLLFDSPKRSDESAYARAVLERFMFGAFRRPVAAEEVDAMHALYETMRPAKANFVEAIKVPLMAVLASPHFLYLVEPAVEDGTPRPLNNFELASRLSYFLWSSMPDEMLFDLAERGELRRPEVLAAQVDRMLAHSKVEALARNFAGQWLGLRKVGANPPVETLFPKYDDHLEQSMVGESEAFFLEILRNDLSVMNFIQSDFVTVNQRMARFYGIGGVKGDAFRRVAVPEGVRRGGLFTQAAMLTITSNGTRTSPVHRGVWILENILGDPPPPPPPDAGDIQPKVPGIDKATVRVRLEAHRRIEQCAGCHRKIDPLGFGLENYHADGSWRDQEGFGYNGRVNRDDPVVDAGGRLPDGREFLGVRELQEILLEEEDQFLMCLAEKLYTYALGRGVELADRSELERFCANMKSREYTLRSLIKVIVQSESFRTK